jgi:hypothetical protein
MGSGILATIGRIDKNLNTINPTSLPTKRLVALVLLSDGAFDVGVVALESRSA